jgi:hypothetical protein
VPAPGVLVLRLQNLCVNALVTGAFIRDRCQEWRFTPKKCMQ